MSPSSPQHASKPSDTAPRGEGGGPGWRTWSVVGVCLAFLLVSYTYNDNAVITLHGMNVWSALGDGQLLHIYQYNYGASPPSPDFHAVPMVYGFLPFVLIAIWNLPLWLLQHFADVNLFTSVVALTWMKLVNVPFALGSAWLVNRISARLAPASRWVPWAGFIFLTSGFLVGAVFVMGQFDVMHVFFILLGLHFLIQGRRRAFVAAFAVAIAVKFFPLFVFLPVLLLTEKRLSRILLSLAGSLSLALALKVPFMFASNPSAKVGSDVIDQMVLGNRLPLGLEGVPVFPFLFALVCIACYLRIPASTEETYRTAVYAGFAGAAVFFLAAPAYPYWYVLLSPFFAILCVINPDRAKVTLLVETGLTAAMIVAHQIFFYWTYDLNIVKPMILPRLFGSVDSLVHQVNPRDLYARLGVVDNRGLLAAVFAAGMVALLYLYRPRSDDELARVADQDTPVDRTVLYGRAAVTMALCLVPASAYFYSLVAHGTVG